MDPDRVILLGAYLHAWCKSMGSKLQKLMFPYDLLDSYKKLRNVGRVCYEDLYSNRKTTIAKDERNGTGMIVQQWVIGWEYATLQILYRFLRP